VRLLVGVFFSSCCLAWSAPSEPPKHITVVVRYEQRPSAVSSEALSRELTSIMSRANVQVEVRQRADQRAKPAYVFSFQMTGYCGMDGPADNSTDHKSLGSTFTSNGQLLPFGQIDCDRIRSSIASAVGARDPQQHQFLYGSAVARVMAHELYHMLAGSANHTAAGLTQGALTGKDLADSSERLPESAAEEIQQRTGR
jgi:hypothetical protein